MAGFANPRRERNLQRHAQGFLGDGHRVPGASAGHVLNRPSDGRVRPAANHLGVRVTPFEFAKRPARVTADSIAVGEIVDLDQGLEVVAGGEWRGACPYSWAPRGLDRSRDTRRWTGSCGRARGSGCRRGYRRHPSLTPAW